MTEISYTNKSSGRRIAIFIDGANFQKATYEALGIQVDFKSLLKTLAGNDILIRAYYYTGEFDNDSIEHYVKLINPHNPDTLYSEMKARLQKDKRFHRFLNRNGYNVVTKGVRVFREADGVVSVKANVDIDIAIGMLTIADRVDKMVLVSGDSDFVPLIEAVAAKGVRVAVVTTQNYNAQAGGYRGSDLLIDAADEYIAIENIRGRIERHDKLSEEEIQELSRQTLHGIIDEKMAGRGFGFILTDDGKKVFFHLSDLEASLQFENLQEGDEVYFEIYAERDERQPYARAKSVRLHDHAYQMLS
ncbi:MAG: NYN domain-containing protein [Deinococcales bacterium]